MEYLVLDEADRLLDLGFEPDVRWIIEKTSQTKRQTAMLSATWPQSVRSLATEFLSDPVLLRVGGEKGASFHDEEGMLQANQRVELNVEVCTHAYSLKLGEEHFQKALVSIHPSTVFVRSSSLVVKFKLRFQPRMLHTYISGYRR